MASQLLQPRIDQLGRRLGPSASGLGVVAFLAQSKFTDARRIQMDIETQIEKPIIRRHGHTLEPSLEQRPHPLMSRVKCAAPGLPNPLHAAAEIPGRRAQDQMVVVFHQTITMNFDPESLLQLFEQTHKMSTILVIREDRPPFDPPIHNVIPTALPLYSQWSRHRSKISPQFSVVNA